MGVLKWPILLPVIPRLALMGFTFCQPFLVNTFLNYLQDPSEDSTPNVGYALIGAYGLVYFGMAVSASNSTIIQMLGINIFEISNGFYAHRAVRCVTMLRALLVTAIFNKTTEISITALDNSAAVTLMSTDVERIARGLREVHDIWAAVIQITLATWLLQREIGLACLAPVIVSASTFPLVSSCLFIELSLIYVSSIFCYQHKTINFHQKASNALGHGDPEACW
jgi:ATP-binding cassette, subfamily C (CFTR/MRP), member 1